MNDQYKNYNYVKVTILNDYVVSNVNTAGIPNKNCGAHLSSLTIESPSIGTGDMNNVGAKGSLSLIDWRNSLFDKLVEHASKLSKNDPNNQAELCPPIEIEIRCFTGVQKYKGSIINWTLNFSGGAPTINIDWTIVTIRNPPKVEDGKADPLANGAKYMTPNHFIEKVQEAFKDQTIEKCVFMDGDSADDNLDLYLEALDKEGFTLDMSTLNNGGTKNHVINCYNYLCKNVKLKDGGGGVVGEVSQTDGMMYMIKAKTPSSNAHKTENSDTNASLRFIQNGSCPEYSLQTDKNNNKYYVIPMTSFDFKIDNSKAVLMYDIIGNINGTVINTNNGTTLTNANQYQNVAEATSNSESTNNSSFTEIEFDCYNVMSFDRNNTDVPISFEVYTESGERHPVSGQAIVTGVTYDISGAVVKAHVKATKSFNDLIIRDVPGQKNYSADDDTGNNESGQPSSTENDSQAPVSGGAH